MNYARLRHEIARDEGHQMHPYTDTEGNLTIGIGWNLTSNGLPAYVIDMLYDLAVARAENVARSFCSSFEELSFVRQRVLVNMAYNLGTKLYQFRRFQAALEADDREDLTEEDFHRAALEMLDSRWARQVGRRAERLADMMRVG